MAISEKRIYLNPAWIGLLVLIALLVWGGKLLLDQQSQNMRRNIEHHAETEMRLVETVVLLALQRGNYEVVDSYITQYGLENDDVVEVKLITVNGFLLSHYKSPVAAIKTFSIETEIDYSYSGQALLELTVDLASVEKDINRLLLQLLVVGFLVVVVFWHLIRLGIRRRLEADILRGRTEELDNANKHLQQEIVERQRAEEAATIANAELSQIFESAADGMRLVDKDFNVFKVNSTFLKLAKLDKDKVVGEKCYDIFFGPRCHTPDCPLTRIFNGEDYLEYEAIKTRMDGSIVPCWVSVTPFRKPNGELIGILESFRDITDRKYAEEELRQAQKMEAIGTLAGGIAHDFNNILYAIQGYTELSMLAVPKESPIHENLEEVIKSTHRAAGLVKQILTFSRKKEQEKQPLLLEHVIKESLKLLRGTIPSTIEIQQDIDKNCSPILADLTQIHQIIINLCTNAADAMREHGGVLTVELQEVKFDPVLVSQIPELTEDTYACLSVSDTGSGMDDKTVARIFDPYFTTKEMGKGTGLGLATVHGIVESHNGAINVESEPGKGTRFDVYFPVITQEIMPGEAAESESSLITVNGHILFVDDEESIVAVVKKALERIGCKVTAFTRSIDALEAFQNNPDSFDAVITDQTMPKLTGVDLAQKILQIRADIPIILATGFSETVDEEQAKAMGIQEFVMKPLTINDLAKVVSSVLEKKSLK